MERIRRGTSLVCGAGLSILAGSAAVALLRAGESLPVGIFGWGALLTLGIGLARHRFWARRLLAAALLVIGIVLPVGYINPFNAADLEQRFGQVPSVQEILIWLVPLEVALLFLVWLLDPPRARRQESLEDPHDRRSDEALE